RDTAGLSLFGQMASELHDQADNLVLISCMQSSFLTQLQSSIRAAAFARIASFGKQALNPLMEPEATELAVMRLNSSEELARVRPPAATRLWPLTDDDIRQAVGTIGCTPRELLAFCASGFTKLQRG